MTHILWRRDLAANWSSSNPVLMEGEAGWETDNRLMKIGDGVTAWNSLPYAMDMGNYAPKANPVFTGDPKAPTPPSSDNDTSIATTAFVKTVVSAAVASAMVTAVAEARLSAHPVGSIYMSASSDNPATALGGTWVAWGSGRVPVGVDGGQTEFNTVEKTGGAKTHTLTAGQIPTHSHDLFGYALLSLTPENFFTAAVSNSPVAANRKMVAYDPTIAGAAETAQIIESNTTQNSTGGGGAHNILQPYITCYMWKRTA